MIQLWTVTFIWAFSYSIIGHYIVPYLDAYMAVFIRSAIGLILFLPFLGKTPNHLKYQLTLIGALQFGITYIFLYQAYHYATTQEILLFTITTPIFVTLITDILHKKLNHHALIATFIAVLGAFIIRFGSISEHFLQGFLLLQLANICFALGQVLYREISPSYPHETHQVFFYFFLGASLINVIAYYAFGNLERVPHLLGGQGNPLSTQTWMALIFVSFIATGLGQYLWCLGAKKVKTAGALAIMNNAVIPIGLIINFIFWDQNIHLLSFGLGSLLMLLALLINRLSSTHQQRPSPKTLKSPN